MVARLIEPGLRQIVDFCGAAPVERVFLEDVARRKLGRFTADRGMIAAGVTLSMIPVVILYLILQRRFIEGITAGALKS